jgi:UDP-3-O-acyl N-acetylglucosamine deacetylase
MQTRHHFTTNFTDTKRISASRMQQIRFQQTIQHVAHVSGRGYWSGQTITLTFLPAQPNAGILFRRVDLPGRPEIQAVATNRRDTNLRTTLVGTDAHVEMIEHVMSALYAMDIDNCIVECDAAEMPGMDGSSHAFVVALEQAGVSRQPAATQVVTLRSPIRVGDDKQWIMAVPSQDVGLTFQYQLDYGSNNPIPASTTTFLLDRDSYSEHISPARTFLTEGEARALQSQGVASHVTYRDLLVFGPTGPIDNALRYEDECSRHKLLDLIGDISLCGLRVQGKIIAHRSGHILNGRMAEAIRNLKHSQQPLEHEFHAVPRKFAA